MLSNIFPRPVMRLSVTEALPRPGPAGEQDIVLLHRI